VEAIWWPKVWYVIVALAAGAPVDVPDDPAYAAAAATVQAYARDMTRILPCAYLVTSDANPRHDTTDATYGAPAVRQVVAAYGSRGPGGFAESLALFGVFSASFKPKWAVRDIRVFARDCHRRKIIEDLTASRGPALPLALRPPFKDAAGAD
jgi:hypothetical protein